jgi:hypothetical protein
MRADASIETAIPIPASPHMKPLKVDLNDYQQPVHERHADPDRVAAVLAVSFVDHQTNISRNSALCAVRLSPIH